MGLTRVNGMLFGGDYTPEQWDLATWDEDVALMREAGVTMVTLPVFGWARLNPAPGEYTFDWLDDILDRLAAAEIAVDLATATASPPAWLVRAHPEILPVTAAGVRLEFGSRQHYCPTSATFRAATVELAGAVAARYADHPALALWHISNEYGDHITECFCDSCATAFRAWLLRRYGTLEALNHAWGTAFWSQRYDDIAHIEPPRLAPGPVNPTQSLDWRRFCSDALLECFELEKAAIRVHSDLPVTTNFMSMMRELDYWKWADAEDVVSDDAYPDPADVDAPWQAALNYDLMRSLADGPWLLLEHAISAVSWREVNVPKRPDQSFCHSLQTVARGADGVMFFQWRASRAGAEKFHSALLPHGGTGSRGWAATLRLGRALKDLAPVVGTRNAEHVAILMDWDNWWALEGNDHPSTRMQWLDTVRSWYEPLWRRHLTVRFVRPGADLTGLPLLLVPNAYLTTTDTATWLADYAAAGGTVVVGAFSGVVDESDHVHPGAHPGPLRELLGVQVDEFWPIPDGERRAVYFADGRRAQALTWHEWVEPEGAQVRATVADGDLAGRPALTRNAVAEGAAWYVPARFADLGEVLAEVLVEVGIQSLPPGWQVPDGVEFTLRLGADGARFAHLVNHTRGAVTVQAAGTDLLTGTRHDGKLTMAPESVAVLVLDEP